MIKREASLTPMIKAYLKSKKIYCYWEAKYAKGDTFYLNSFEPHQIESLMAAHKEGLFYKFSDMDSRIKPFDGINTPPLQSYIIVKFTKAFVFFRAEFIQSIIEKGNTSLMYPACIVHASHILDL